MRDVIFLGGPRHGEKYYAPWPLPELIPITVDVGTPYTRGDAENPIGPRPNLPVTFYHLRWYMSATGWQRPVHTTAEYDGPPPSGLN